MKKIVSCLVISYSLCSCVQIRGVGDDYKHLTPFEKSLVEPFNNENSLKMSKVYKTNATMLLKALKDYPKAFVYVYTVGCVDDTCKPLAVYEEYAQKNGYKVFFILTSYMDLDVALLEPRNTPLFVIDSKYYGNKLFRAYVDDFKNELKGRDRKAKGVYEGGLLFYENGIYKKSYTYLPTTEN